MRQRAMLTALTTALGPVATAFAASGADYEGVSILMILFMGFGAMIISFQGILVAALLFTMVKALFTKPIKDPSALAADQANNGH